MQDAVARRREGCNLGGQFDLEGQIDRACHRTGYEPPVICTPSELPEAGREDDTTFDIYLNGEAFRRDVPAAVRTYRLGGHQILKKRLSCRERNILERALRPEEGRHFTDTARRIGSIVAAIFTDPT